MDVRLRSDKFFAYVDFNSEGDSNEAFKKVKDEKVYLNNKKIVIAQCDTNKAKIRKQKSNTCKVVFLKNIAYKAKEKDLRKFFSDRSIKAINMKGKGMA